MAAHIGPTKALRRRMERMLAAGAELPDLDWDTMPAADISRVLHGLVTQYREQQYDKRVAARRRMWREGDLPAPVKRQGFGGQ